MKTYLFFAVLIFASVNAQAERVEGCMVVEKVGSSFDPKTGHWATINYEEYDIPSDLSQKIEVTAKGIANFKYTLTSGPGMYGSDKRDIYTVVAEVEDLAAGIKTKSFRMVFNESGADDIGKNMESFEYRRANNDLIQINCAMIDHQ